MRVELMPSYLIHRRAYRDTSVLVDFFTQDYGMIRCVARGIRQGNSQLPMFVRLKISFSGKKELKTLASFETADTPRMLQKEALFIGMYVNELLSRLLPFFQAQDQLFASYAKLLNILTTIQDKTIRNWHLRLFERDLLAEMGYGLNYQVDHQGSAINPDQHYRFETQIGFIADNTGLFSGALLMKLSQAKANDIPDKAQLIACRDLFRAQIDILLDNQPLYSRQLFTPPSPQATTPSE